MSEISFEIKLCSGCAICVAKTKALIMICIFIFAYTKAVFLMTRLILKHILFVIAKQWLVGSNIRYLKLSVNGSERINNEYCLYVVWLGGR